MKDVIRIVPLVLYLIIGSISLVMAIKTLFARRLLSFQEKAYGNNWERIDNNLQHVFLALLKISGLGFLIIALLLLSSPIYNYFNPSFYLQFVIPMIVLVFSTGLFVFNYILFKKTKAITPWKNSLYTIMGILFCILLSTL